LLGLRVTGNGAVATVAIVWNALVNLMTLVTCVFRQRGGRRGHRRHRAEQPGGHAGLAWTTSPWTAARDAARLVILVNLITPRDLRVPSS
jgi:hypothetical protein